MLGVAPHSLRAVTPDELGQVVRLPAPTAPIHIHAAEQTREVDDCFAWSRLRPVEWLVTQAHVDARWCLVHATHMTEREVAALAATGAVAGLAPTTEADLGDGTFPGAAYLGANGRFAIGSDSNTQISPFLELRQLEWSQRMRARRRNVLPAAVGAAIGASLWTGAARGGAQALAQTTGHDRDRPARRPRRPRHDRSRAGRTGPPRRARCRDLRTVAPAGARRARPRPIPRARRTPRAGGSRVRALSRSARAARAARMTPARFDLLLVDAHLATMRAEAGAYGAIRDGAIGVVGDAIAWVGAARRPAARRRRRDHAGVRWRMDHAGTRRLPHASRLRGQSLRRIRAPAPGRHVRRHRT